MPRFMPLTAGDLAAEPDYSKYKCDIMQGERQLAEETLQVVILQDARNAQTQD